MNNLNTNVLKIKPIVFVGKYQDIIENLLGENILFLKPKVIWIEYRTIPIFKIMRSLRDHPQLSSQSYFLEISSLEALNHLLRSRALLRISQHGFSTLIIDVPEYCSIPIDFYVRFQELMRKTNIILIMESELTLSRSQINLIRVE